MSMLNLKLETQFILKNRDFLNNTKVNKHKVDNASKMFNVAFSNHVIFLTEVRWAHFCNFQAQPAAKESWISGRIEAHQKTLHSYYIALLFETITYPI